MTRRPVLRRTAQADVAAAADWYDTERPGLGSEFLEEIDRLLVRVEAAPNQFPVIEDPVRRCLARRFPYALYFVTVPDLVVIAVLHLHRDVEAWRERMPGTRVADPDAVHEGP